MNLSRLGPASRVARWTTALTRVDLAGVLAGLTLLALLLRPALANNGAVGETLVCLDNHRRLLKAWLSFAAENGGQLPGNYRGSDPRGLSISNATWVVGQLDYSSFPYNTNTLYLLQSQLGAHIDGDVSVFRCPSDRSVTQIGTNVHPRTRSVAMNGCVGENPTGNFWARYYSSFRRLGDITLLSPAECFVFIDEREDSINDGFFAVSMEGFDPPEPETFRLVDFPASYHAGGATLSFADGHAATWVWKDPRTNPALRPGQRLQLDIPSPNNLDVARLQRATSRRISDATR